MLCVRTHLFLSVQFAIFLLMHYLRINQQQSLLSFLDARPRLIHKYVRTKNDSCAWCIILSGVRGNSDMRAR